MDSYTGFAQVYDEYMEDVPYEKWREQILAILKQHNIEGGLGAELGCGTGNMTRLMAEAGFDMIGIDSSYEMLDEAREKQMEAEEGSPEKGILYLCQDMRSFELYGTVNVIYALCDTMNYITDTEDLRKVIALADNYLDPKGLFIFDLRTDAFYREIGSSTIADHREDGSFIWENEYDEEQKLNIYNMTFYIEEEDAPGHYQRFEETHYTKAHDPMLIKEMILDQGMEFVGILDAATMQEPSEDSTRLYIIAKEIKKRKEV